MALKLNIQAGDKYARLTVVCEAPRAKGNKRRFLCSCLCGGETIVTIDNLNGGHTKSCGCYALEVNKYKKTTHGKSNTRLYEIWSGMKKRCLNPKNHAYKYYGGRGIHVYKDWLDFPTFYDWAMANGYQKNLTIDRIDSNGNYEPSNCRWMPLKEQNNNKTSSHKITFRSETKTLRDWAKDEGLNYSTLHGRLQRGWTVAEALTKPTSKENPRWR